MTSGQWAKPTARFDLTFVTPRGQMPFDFSRHLLRGLQLVFPHADNLTFHPIFSSALFKNLVSMKIQVLLIFWKHPPQLQIIVHIKHFASERT